jgi:two-component system, response regulator PdtaR
MIPSGDGLRVAVADDDPAILEFVRDLLEGMGHTVTASCSTGQELIDACATSPPDLIVTDVKMPGVDGIEAATTINRRQATPVILVTSFGETELISRALRTSVLAYLIKPIKQIDLEVAVAVAIRRFREHRAVCDMAAALRQSLEERKQVERAKGVLMRRGRLGEEEAYKRLQKISKENSRKLPETARMVIAIDREFCADT